jgi:hypothetical protein
MSDQQYFKDYTNINTLMTLRDKTEDEIEQDLSPFGFIDDGREEFMDDDFEKFVSDSWMWRTQDF